MSLKTRLGNLGNILAEDESQTRLLQLDSPVLSNAGFAAMRNYMGDSAMELDCTFRPEKGENALRRAVWLRRIAEDAVRGGAAHLILSDRNIGTERAAIPMILATAAVHNHLIDQALRTYTSLNVRSAECLDTHYSAILIGVGASTVNAYLAQETIIDRHRAPVRRHAAIRLRSTLSRSGRPGASKDHVQDGYLDPVELSRRPQVRGRRS